MTWKQDDIGSFANHGGCSAQVARHGRRWLWVVFAGDREVARAHSRTMDDAQSNAEIMLRKLSRIA